MKTRSMLLLLLLPSALAQSTPAAVVSCTRSAYEVEGYAQTVGRSSREEKLSTSGSCRIVKIKRGLSLEAIPGMLSAARCRFVIFGDSPLRHGWRIEGFHIETSSQLLKQLPPNEFELRADDPEEIAHALLASVILNGPDCNKWREAFDPAAATGDPARSATTP